MQAAFVVLPNAAAGTGGVAANQAHFVFIRAFGEERRPIVRRPLYFEGLEALFSLLALATSRWLIDHDERVDHPAVAGASIRSRIGWALPKRDARDAFRVAEAMRPLGNTLRS